jgi:hypothetical protein
LSSFRRVLFPTCTMEQDYQSSGNKQNYYHFVKKKREKVICLQFEFSSINHCCNCSIFILHYCGGTWLWAWVSNDRLTRYRTFFCDFPPAISYMKLVHLVLIFFLHVLSWNRFNWWCFSYRPCSMTPQLNCVWTKDSENNQLLLGAV